jgi:predicted DsbA family dithiol-disulfide isomerase
MVTVEIWSDVVCPWCYLGRLNWRAALERFPHTDQLRTRWRSFELRPHLPQGQGGKLVDIMRNDWKMSENEIEGVFERIRGDGAAGGATLRPESVRPVNTFDTHRLLHFAEELGVVDTLLDRLFKAYHYDIADLSDLGVLRSLAVESGIDAAVADEVLHSDRFADQVREDERRAPEVGVTAVPSYRIGTHRAVSGALGVDELLSLLHARWQDAAV